MKCAFVFLIYIIVNENIFKTYAFRVFDVNGVETILALDNEQISIECKMDEPMAYCGFLHPDGNRSSFSGSSLGNGHCAKRINATVEDSGEWRCHIGRHGIGAEALQIIRVRVVKQLAAVQENVSTVHGKQVTLSCVTTAGLIPLRYCRFEPPTGLPFSIDSSVTSTNPILKGFYFPANKSLDRGDCAVTLRKVKYEDVGLWTCGAGFDDGNEHTDQIKLDVEGLYTMSTASATGIAFGIIGVVAFLGLLGFIAWKKRHLLGSTRQESEPEQEMQEIQDVPRSRQSTPHRSPVGRHIPRVTVQSPSEPSESPLMP